jgi:adenylate cyclase
MPRWKPPVTEEQWRMVLDGTLPGLSAMSRTFRRLPAAPRCKLCMAPFAGPVAALFRLAGYGRWQLNTQMCRICIRKISDEVGGAEASVSMLYADVRGSTAIAEDLGPSEMTKLLNRFFDLVAKEVDGEGGLIDHIVGDGVMAMWVKGFVGPDHARHAVAAGVAIAEATSRAELPVGCGVHTGEAFVGIVGAERGVHDFTVVGDVANTTARLGSAAKPGELLVSADAAAAAGLDLAGRQCRSLELRGKAQPLDTWVLVAGPAVDG